ncbi:GDSL-type esterase/lipase family protein [Mucilaginibacter litoreus]|uniref:GDSL-type esterase/lipase family protein n=1 Tax=Mucilaginibacter litoreus TaxID=1048221 RepID=A0ABW3APU6_9SPHI
MKKLCLLMLLMPALAMAQSIPTNQNLFDTIPFIPDHTVERLKVFATQPVKQGGTIFLGDSITEMGDWGKATGDSTVLNRGIGGDITYGVLKRLDDVINRQPKKLFILLGINDIGKDIPDAVIAYNYFRIISRVHAKSSGTQIYVQSILPVDPTHARFPQHYDKGRHVAQVNNLLKAKARELNFTYVNIAQLFTDKRGLLKPEYTIEGLHLNAKAYMVWAAYLKKLKYL